MITHDDDDNYLLLFLIGALGTISNGIPANINYSS